jgi:hypothetical protein
MGEPLKTVYFITHPMPPSERSHPGGLSTQVEREIRGVFRGSHEITINISVYGNDRCRKNIGCACRTG